MAAAEMIRDDGCMTDFVGADPVQLRALSQQMARSADRIGASLRTLGSVLEAPGQWLGPDMQSFRQSWHGELIPQSTSVIMTLLEASRALQSNADEQEKASQGGSGTQSTGTEGGTDRRAEGRGSAGSRTGRGEQGTDPGGHTTGSEAFPGGLGSPVPGDHVPKPEAPPWSSDKDSQVHDSADPGFGDHATKLEAEVAANAATPLIPHASRNLLHFLGNSGAPLDQDVDQMLRDCPELSQQTTADVGNLAKAAVEDARNSGTTEPVTYPVNTEWKGYYIGKDESADWFYASGGISYSTQGQVTVYPPKTPGGEWSYSTDTTVSYRGRYNWDGTKSTDIGPVNITDKQLGRLNEVGIAQNYNMTGESSTHHSSGRVK